MSDELSSYDELISILDHLPVLIREKRRRLGLSYRAAGAQVPGVADTTIFRVETGAGSPSLDNAISLLRWLGSPDIRKDGAA